MVHPAHEWEHFIDISYAAQNISIIADGPERKTVISLDIRLYLEPAKKLQMAQNVFQNGFPKTLPELSQCLENLSREVIEAFREGKKEKNREPTSSSSAASVPRKSLKRC